MVITSDFNLNYLNYTFRSLISLKTVKIPKVYFFDAIRG